MTVKRNLLIGASFLTVLAALAVAERSLQQDVIAQQKSSMQAPRFEVDPYWPKPLPNNWIMGQAAGVAVDAQDHVWVVQRPGSLTDDEKGAAVDPPRSKCCRPAPPESACSRRKR